MQPTTLTESLVMDGKDNRVRVSRGMPVSQSALFGVIVDFESYPEFVSGVKTAKIVSSSDTECHVQFGLEVIRSFEYELRFFIQGESQVRWELVKSSFFQKNEGAWLLSPIDSSHTEATYELEVGFNFLVPKIITSKLVASNLPHMLKEFEARALKVRKSTNGRG